MSLHICPNCLMSRDDDTSRFRQVVFDLLLKTCGGPISPQLLCQKAGVSEDSAYGRLKVLRKDKLIYKDLDTRSDYYITLKGIEFLKATGADVAPILRRIEAARNNATIAS